MNRSGQGPSPEPYRRRRDQSKDYPDWFLWIWENGFLLTVGCIILSAVVAGIIAYFDHRLDQVEDRLIYVPPASYQPPDVENYVVADVDIDTLPVRKLVYVPVYSHVYYQGGSPYPLETTLSIRNTDLAQTIYLNSVKYFDTSGKLVKTHLDQTIGLGPLQTIEYLIEQRDSSGGSGANFLVEWAAERQTEKPVIEALMVGISGRQGISFARTGIEISSPVLPTARVHPSAE